jgi:three-Cys-motif partner protein
MGNAPVVDPFFTESAPQSRIKARIVAQYFSVWAKVIAPTTREWGGTRIGYFDLYAGPGRYTDGTKSTPLMVLETAIADAALSSMLVSIFNDAAPAHATTLVGEIQRLPGIEKLRHQPQILTSEVGDAMVEMFDKIRLIPSLVFIDPFGYKGLSIPLIKAMIKDWGCDCLFFFNYNRINMGLTNMVVDHHMENIFGADGIAALRERVRGRSSGERELLVIDAMVEALRGMGGRFVLPFGFRRENHRLTHHLIFVTKHFRGYEIMREIMAPHSTRIVEGVPSLEHSLREQQTAELELPLTRPLDELGKRLLRKYSGRQLTVRELFEVDSVGRPYLLSNYKDALRRLEIDGRVDLDPPADRRRPLKGQPTMNPKKTRVSFP